MTNPAPQLVPKLWNYCNLLRDDGLSYGDYGEQLTFLRFLKMADAQSRPPFNKPSRIPKGADWPAVLAKDGDELEIHYRHTLKELGKRAGKRSDLDDFVACYNPKNRHSRKESERFKAFTYDELTKRDKVNLDIFWLKDDALEESANLPAPEIIAQEITDDLEAALAQFATIAEDLKP